MAGSLDSAEDSTSRHRAPCPASAADVLGSALPVAEDASGRADRRHRRVSWSPADAPGVRGSP
jgi:hypothetical protein